MIGTDWFRVPVQLLNYSSKPALRFEPNHCRLLLYSVSGLPFWSTPCHVAVASRLSDRRLIGIITARKTTPCIFLSIVNVIVADITRNQLCKALDFSPFEIQSGHPLRLEYQFLLRGRNDP